MPFGVKGLVLKHTSPRSISGTRDEDYGLLALTLAWVRDLAFLGLGQPRAPCDANTNRTQLIRYWPL